MPDICDRYIDTNQNRTLPTANKKSVDICNVRQMNHQCLFIWRVEALCCGPPTGRHIALQLAILTVIYVEWPSTRGVGTRSHLKGLYFCKCIRVGNLSIKPAVGTVWPSLWSAKLLAHLPHTPVVGSRLSSPSHKCSDFCRLRLESWWNCLRLTIWSLNTYITPKISHRKYVAFPSHRPTGQGSLWK